jgi:hypothetical protein
MSRSRIASYVVGIAIPSIVVLSASLYLGLGTSNNSSTFNTSLSSSPAGTATSTNTVHGTKVGSVAPDFQVQLINGTIARLNDFRGHPVLLWFVTVGCSSCEAGAQLLSQQYYSQLHNKGVTILTVQLYNNLGLEGSSISEFASQFGGARQGWLFGTSNQDTTYTYDPKALLDIHYVLDSQGRLVASGAGLAAALPSIVSTF